MAITQLENGNWKADVEPVKGKRFRKTFKTKGEAQRFEATCRAKLIETPDWAPKPKDTRRLKELIQRWADLHAQTLADGEARKRLLLMIATDMRNPIGAKLTGKQYADYRAEQLSKGANPKTLNNRLGYLRAMFNVLHHLGETDYPNPFDKVKALRLQERELSYLDDGQINHLFAYLHQHCRTPHVAMVATICLATGARWGEAQALTPDKVQQGRLYFVNTKGKKTRAVPIAADLEQRIRQHFTQHGLFSNCINSFCKALAASGVKVPAGQSSHVLRHTFASRFVMNGGNILTLQRILGHTSLAMTMRYAHLAPEHLQDAVTYGPVTDFKAFFAQWPA